MNVTISNKKKKKESFTFKIVKIIIRFSFEMDISTWIKSNRCDWGGGWPNIENDSTRKNGRVMVFSRGMSPPRMHRVQLSPFGWRGNQNRGN